MDFIDSFPIGEREKRKLLNRLMDDWKTQAGKHRVWDEASQRFFRADEYICTDGFYPYYFQQKPRILFIAREAVQMCECDYIETLLSAYREDCVANVTVNRHAFHSRMMYIAYGAIKGNFELDYDDLPTSSSIARTFGTTDGISFAFMELSKYSNESDDANSRCDSKLMKQFLIDSDLEHTEFIKKELALLEPDVIITMNLWECGIDGGLIETALGKVSQICENKYFPYATLNSLTVGSQDVPLIDLAHFSSRKSHKGDFYDPAMRIMRDLFEQEKGMTFHEAIEDGRK